MGWTPLLTYNVICHLDSGVRERGDLGVHIFHLPHVLLTVHLVRNDHCTARNRYAETVRSNLSAALQRKKLLQ